MRSSDVRHTIRLRLTLVGPSPEIWREVLIGRDHSLDDLRRVIQCVFEGPLCRHHVYTDDVDSAVWSRTRRRWGDRWTMIDLRDPTVIDETTARIGSVMRGVRSLHYRHTCTNGWLVEIEPHEDDLVAASDPPVRIIGGERRAPLACFRGAYEHTVLVRVLDDPAHPERDRLISSLERAVGPWAHFDPAAFDLADAQRRLDLLDLGAPARRSSTSSRPIASLAGLVERLPLLARAGLGRHLAVTGVDLPPVVTTDEARRLTCEFGWIISRAVGGGIPLVDGVIDPTVVREGAEALGIGDDRMLRLVAFARRGRLLYSRNGRLLASKRSEAAAAHPGDLWSMIARDLVRAVAPTGSGDLLLLAVADGSLGDPAVGTRRISEALALLDRGHACYDWSYDREPGCYDWGYDREPGCEQTCDCSGDGYETWHDIVARAIRNASILDSGDEGTPLTARLGGPDTRDLGFVPDWFEEPSSPRPPVAVRSKTTAMETDAVLPAELAGLVELLGMLGLQRDDGGTWVVPPILRELAKESLQSRVAHGWF